MLLCAFVCGAWLGIVYDIQHLCRIYWIEDASKNKSSSTRMMRFQARLAPSRTWNLPSLLPKARTVIANIVLFFQDVLFGIIFAVTVILLLYRTNDGQFRISAIAVVVIGILIYRISVGRVVRVVLAYGMIVVGAALAWAGALLMYPVRLLGRLMKRFWLPQYRKCRERFFIWREKRKARIEQRKMAGQPTSEAIFAQSIRREPDGRSVFCTGKRPKPPLRGKERQSTEK